jgi:hypothetical protein
VFLVVALCGVWTYWTDLSPFLDGDKVSRYIAGGCVGVRCPGSRLSSVSAFGLSMLPCPSLSGSTVLVYLSVIHVRVLQGILLCGSSDRDPWYPDRHLATGSGANNLSVLLQAHEFA